MPLTRVVLLHTSDLVNVWLRFGHPTCETIIDSHRRVAEFLPGSIFCRVRWEGNEYGTTLWQLSILQAAPSINGVRRFVGVEPGGVLLLHVNGSRKVQSVLRLIDAAEVQRIDPADVAPSYWCVVNNRLAARLDVSPYTRERHNAHQRRKSVM